MTQHRDSTPNAQHNTLLKFKLEISHFNGGARECDTVERQSTSIPIAELIHSAFSRPTVHIKPYTTKQANLFWRDHR